MEYNKQKKELEKQLKILHYKALRDGYKIENGIYVKDEILHVIELYNYSVGICEEYGYFNIFRKTKYISEEDANKFKKIDLTPYNQASRKSINSDEYEPIIYNLFELLENLECKDFVYSLDYHSQLQFIYGDSIFQYYDDMLEECKDNFIDGLEKVYFELNFYQEADAGISSEGYISVFSIQKDKYKRLPDLNESFSKTIKDN